MRKLPAQPVNGLIDGLTILQELATRDGSISCGELAKELGMELTRVNRLLKTLDYLGMANRTHDRRYQAGPGVHVLAAQALSKSKLLQKVAPRLLAIDAPGCIKALGVLWHDKVSYLMHKSETTDFMESLGRINAYPATKSSLGMALLAHLEEQEIETLFKNRETPDFHSHKEFLKELERTRKRGYGRLETAPGVISIAYTIGIDTPQGAIAISGPMERVLEESYRSLLADAAKEISQEI